MTAMLAIATFFATTANADIKTGVPASSITIDAKTSPAAATGMQKVGGDCNSQLAYMTDQLKATTAELQEAIHDCHPNWSIDDWRKAKQCGKIEPPKKAYIVVNYCEFPSKKVGNNCVCEGREINGRKPFATYLIDSKKPWERHITCTYDASVIDGLDEQIGLLCDPLNMVVTPEQVEAGVAPSTERCKQAKEVVASVTKWSNDLRTDKNGTPKFDRDMWERVWAMLQNHENAFFALCGRKGDETPEQACARSRAELDAWRKKKDAKDQEQDLRLDNHEERIENLEKAVGRGEWRLPAELRYVARLSNKVTDSTQLRLLPGYGYWTSQQFGFEANGAIGYVMNKTENRYDFGAEFMAMYAFSAERSVMLRFGISADAEIVPRGTDAANMLGVLGLEMRPIPELFIGVNAGFGASLVTVITNGERQAMSWGNAGMIGLTLGGVIPTGVKKIAPPVTTRTTTTTVTSESKSE